MRVPNLHIFFKSRNYKLCSIITQQNKNVLQGINSHFSLMIDRFEMIDHFSLSIFHFLDSHKNIFFIITFCNCLRYENNNLFYKTIIIQQ